jgi:glycosyltransferase involved in cell wall biosynthesis
MLRIFLDGRIFSQQKSGGISKYWAELIKAFAADHNPQIESVALRLAKKADYNIFLPELKSSIAGSVVHLVSSWNLWLHRDKPSIIHSPYMFSLDMLKSGIRVLTVHDLIHKKVRPQTLRGWLRGKMLDFSLAFADAYICVSGATKSELHQFYPETIKKPYRVIYHGINADFALDSRTRKIQGLPEKYVLFIGQRHGYKNFRILLRALAGSSALESLHIVCAGGPNFDQIEQEELQNFGLESRTTHIAAPTESQLQSLYENGVALAYPSTMEGFGMPILEAMARGCPVICSSESSMGEIAAGLNYSIDPNETESLREILKHLLIYGAEPDRIAKGILHARAFSWKVAQNETVAFYTELLELKSAFSRRT